MPRLPHPRLCFFKQSVFEGEIGHDFFQRLRLSTKVLHLVPRSCTSSEVAARRVTGKPFLAGLQELFRPAVVHRRGDALAATEFGNALLAARPFQNGADLLLG